MTRHPSCAVVLLLALLLPARATCADYALGADDNLTVKVYEWPDISGDYRIGADGKIAFPVIGDVSATGLTVDQLGRTIGEMLGRQARLKDSLSVAVQVREYRPFFITGDVQKPGAYPFRPGLTVLQAVTVAGGFFRFADPGLLRLERDAIIHRGELRILREKLAALRARDARLKAEREGDSAILFPDDADFDRSDPKVAAMVDRETTLFRTEKADLERQLASLKDLQNLYSGEIAALQAQIESEKKQGDLIQREIDELRGLASRGLTSNPRLFLVERTFAEIEGTQRNLQAVIMRSRQSIAQAAQQADELKIKFRNRIDSESDQVGAEIRDARLRIDTTNQLIVEAAETAPVAIARRLRNAGAEPRFRLSRRTPDGAKQEVDAGSLDLVEPGDVVLVDNTVAEPVETGSNATGLRSGRAELSESR
jgi:protein involved in polysaccharide export with SLBB domain